MKIEPYKPHELWNVSQLLPDGRESSSGSGKGEHKSNGQSVLDGQLRDKKVCFCFGGGGYYGNIFLGIIKFIQEAFSPEYVERYFCFAGESAGAAFASYAVLGIPYEKVCKLHRDHTIASYNQRDQGLTKVKESSENLLKEAYSEVFRWPPKKVQKAVRDRLMFTTNQLRPCKCGMETLKLTNFDSMEDMMVAIVASAYIPIAMPILEFPRLGGKFVVDGGFTVAGSVPCFNDCTVVYCLACGTPSPGVPEQFKRACITPSVINNNYTFNMMFPYCAEEFDKLVEDGYNQAKKYFLSTSYFRQKIVKIGMLKESRMKFGSHSERTDDVGVRACRNGGSAQNVKKRNRRAASKGRQKASKLL